MRLCCAFLRSAIFVRRRKILLSTLMEKGRYLFVAYALNMHIEGHIKKVEFRYSSEELRNHL